MKRHHWKSDLLLPETFYNLEGSIRKQVAVPTELRIDYFTDPCGARFTVERHGASCTNCFVSEDGMTLTAAVPLSRQPVGEGSLFHLITEYVQDGNFPEGKRAVATPGVTDVILTTGASDESIEAVSESVLQTIMYGYSAYQLAVLNGYKGTEEEYVQAPILAQSVVEQFKKDFTKALSKKADIDETGHVVPQQIAPQQGRQQGVRTEYGYYKSTAASLNPEGSQTHVATFVTGADVTTDQCILGTTRAVFSISNGSMYSPMGGGTVPVKPNSLYQAVYSVDMDGNTASLYLNSIHIITTATFSAVPGLNIGKYSTSTIKPFKGTVISYRQFSFAMCAEDVAEVWNGGRPVAWRVPTESDLCTASFEPESLLPDGWRNLIDGGTDLEYTSYEDDTVAVFDYTAAEEPYTADVVRRGLMTTGAVMGSGLFNTSTPALIQKDVQHTTVLLFVTPASVPQPAMNVYIEGADGTHGYGALVQYNGNVILYFRGQNLQSKSIPVNTLCCVVFSYFGDDKIITSIDGTVVVNDAPEFLYMHNPQRCILGGTENGVVAGNLTKFRFVGARRFNFAMDEGQIAQVFNNGYPERWCVPDEWRKVRQLGWPTGKWQAGSGTWSGNNGDMTHAADVPAENGFSGTFQRSVINTGSILSLFCSFQYSNSIAGYGLQRIRFEYRSDKPFSIDGISYPANTSNAKEAVWVGNVNKYVALYVKGGTAGSYIEIRTLEVAAIGCLLDLVPEGLSPRVWLDASGQGNDIPYIPAPDKPADCELSYEQITIPQSITDEEKKAIATDVKALLPTSYPANGGNSDTVDGKHADNFVNVVIPNNPFTTGSIETFITFLQQSGVFPTNKQGSSAIWFPFNFPGAITSAFGTIVLSGAKVTVDMYASNQFMLTIQTAESGILYQYTPMFGLVTAAGATPNGLTISLNGTSQGAFNGSAAKSIDITASSIGAIPALGFPATTRQTTYLRWNLGVAATLYVPGSDPADQTANGHSLTFKIRPGDPVYVIGFNPSLPVNESGLTVMAQTSQEVDIGEIVFQPDNNINLIGATIFTAVPIGYSVLRITGFMFFPTPGITYSFTK